VVLSSELVKQIWVLAFTISSVVGTSAFSRPGNSTVTAEAGQRVVVESAGAEQTLSPSEIPSATPRSAASTNPRTIVAGTSGWHYDSEVSWYGPGFYGKRTACGIAYTTAILGVAHRSLPCGTLVEFKYGERSKVVPVIDRGPYVSGRSWDLSGGLCVYLQHCFTGGIWWKMIGSG
jgi:rare lipoprotein A (peptidoglycan hydrolase)